MKIHPRANSKRGRRYGYIPDRPSRLPWLDHRALMIAAPTPDVVAWDGTVTWCVDQKAEGSCTAFSGTSSMRYVRKQLGLPDFDYSQQFLYYATRDAEGNSDSDSGASILDTVATEQSVGVCEQSLWPYTMDLTERPSPEAYADALTHAVIIKAPVEQTLEALCAVLASGRPIHYGMSVYESFESDETAATGIVPIPGANERCLGGHALWLRDYDRIRGVAIGFNSWGPQWGLDGLCRYEIPLDYVLNPDLASDFWTATTVQ